MPLPVLIVGGVVVGAYILGRFLKKDREEDLENQRSISEGMRSKERSEYLEERKKTRKDIIKELIDK